MKRLGFLLSLLLPLAAPLALLNAHVTGWVAMFSWTPVFFAFGLLPVVDALVGIDTRNPSEAQVKQLMNDRFFPLLTFLVVPLQVMSLLVCGWAFIAGVGGWPGQLGFLVSAGVISGSTAITTAHELIHKPGKWAQRAGSALLATVCYATFKPEHLYGHHRHVATPEDGSTAFRGETVYAFIARSLWHNPVRGFRLAAEHLRRRGLPVVSRHNDLIGWSALSVLLLGVSAWVAGWLGALFFVGQAFIAICLLEIINYVEHYGLMREKMANGRYERVSPRHSWNANHLVTNLFLFHLQRHSDHHANGARPYQSLRHFDESPQLPFGYATAVLAALVPPIWFRVMDTRLDAQP
ncbi:MAG: alkane 1-monooxygenase [Pseudomonadota bacterium]